MAHAVVEILDLHELAGRLQVLDDALAAFFLGQARVGARLGGHVAVLVDALDEFEAVALQSLGSWQGVTLSAPVPNSLST